MEIFFSSPKKKWQRILTGTEILKTIRDHGPLPELPERYNEKKPLLNRLGESKWLKK
jgi:hypothetical protein